MHHSGAMPCHSCAAPTRTKETLSRSNHNQLFTRGCRPPIIRDVPSGSNTTTTSARSFSPSWQAWMPTCGIEQVVGRLQRSCQFQQHCDFYTFSYSGVHIGRATWSCERLTWGTSPAMGPRTGWRVFFSCGAGASGGATSAMSCNRRVPESVMGVTSGTAGHACRSMRGADAQPKLLVCRKLFNSS